MNTGAEGANGTTRGASMHIDSAGGVVDGARDEVNDGAQTWMVQGAWARGVPTRTEGAWGVNAGACERGHRQPGGAWWIEQGVR